MNRTLRVLLPALTLLALTGCTTATPGATAPTPAPLPNGLVADICGSFEREHQGGAFSGRQFATMHASRYGFKSDTELEAVIPRAIREGCPHLEYLY